MAEIINEYLDLSHEYQILVPLTFDAEDKLYRGEIYANGEISDDFAKMIFNEDVFEYLEDRLFDYINVKCGTLINMYEEEIIEKSQLEAVISMLQGLISRSDESRFIELATEFKKLVDIAISKGTIIGFYF